MLIIDLEKNESYILKEEFLSLINHDAEINYNPIFKTVLSDYSINTKTIPPIYDFQSGVLNINVTGSSDGYQYGGIITRDKSYIISENYSILEFKNAKCAGVLPSRSFPSSI